MFKPEFLPIEALTLTPEQAAILSILDRIEALEKRVEMMEPPMFKSRRAA